MVNSEKNEAHWLGAVVNVVTRDTGVMSGLMRAFKSAGLEPDYYTVVPVTSEIAKRSLTDTLSGFLRESAKAPENIRKPFDRRAFMASLAHEGTAWIELGNGALDWMIRVPMEPGFIAGRFNPGFTDILGKPFIDATNHVFNMCLTDWKLCGPKSILENFFAHIHYTEIDTPVELPGTGWLNYLSTDFAYQEDVMRLRDIEGWRIIRTYSGATVFALRSTGNDGVIGRFRSDAPNYFKPWARPLVDVYPLPDRTLLLRDVSPGFADFQKYISGAAFEHAANKGCLNLKFDLPSLEKIDACLKTEGRFLPSYVLEGWSAIAGEVAVAFCGQWRRILNPKLGFPENFLVELPGGITFQPHVSLMDYLENRIGLTPAQVLRKRLQQIGSA